MATARVTITIPEELLAAADRRAEELRRSRSFVLAEALRAWLREAPALVREAPAGYVPGPGPSRLGQLRADLALTPEERVTLAEETALVGELTRPRRQRDQILLFESFAEYHAWERREATG